jgi:hypothetical protein
VRVLTALAVALITALAGAVGAYFLGDWLTTLYRMSDSDGGRTAFVIFVCPPAGFVVAFWIGFIASLWSKTQGWVGFGRGVAIGMGGVAVLAGVISAGFYVMADKPPTISGHLLNFEFELKLPPANAVPQPIERRNLRVTFYGNPSEGRIAFVDYTGARRVDGALLIKGSSYMFSSRPGRLLSVDFGSSAPVDQAIGVGLAGHPSKQDEQWSEWQGAIKRGDAGPVPELEQISARWRVQEIVK